VADAPSTPPNRPWSPRPERKGATTQITELKDLVVGYAKQETVDPLRTLGRYLGFGIAGAFCIGSGIVFGLLALLRGLQQIPVFNRAGEFEGGRFSWAPYVIVLVAGLVIAGLFLRTLYRMTQNPPGGRADAGRNP